MSERAREPFYSSSDIDLTGLLAAIIGNVQPFTRFYPIKAQFSDATGLLKTDVVKVAGVTVGKVSKAEVDIDPRTGKAKAIVTLLVRKTVDVPNNAHAEIRFRNLLGQRMIVITRDQDEPGAPPISKKGDAVIPLSRTSPAFDLGIVFNNLKPVLKTLNAKDVNTISAALVKVFGGREARIHEMFRELGDLSDALGARGPIITELVTNLSRVAQTVAARDADLRSILDSLDALLGTLSGHSTELARALDNLGVASAGTAKIIADNRPGLDDTIAKLRTILDLLVAHKNDLDRGLRNLPAATEALSRATTYGKWVNLNGVCINGICGAGFSSTEAPLSSSVSDMFLAAAGERR